MLEVKQLIAEVAARNGIRIDEHDPAFCLVTINQLVLEETARDIVDEIRSVTQDFERAAEKVQSRAGVILAQALKEMMSSIRHELDVQSARTCGSVDRRYRVFCMAVGTLLSLVVFACGVLVGTALR
jgi:hypothetical protein